jgi:hypothetical protein
MILIAKPAPALPEKRAAGVATIQWRVVTSALAVLAAGTVRLVARHDATSPGVPDTGVTTLPWHQVR